MDNTYLPAFDRDVRVWFAQLESCFVANNASSEHQQLHILFSALWVSLTPTIKDIVTNPFLGSTYVKQEILLRMSLSAGKRFKNLVNNEYLGGHKLSHLLQHIRSVRISDYAFQFVKCD